LWGERALTKGGRKVKCQGGAANKVDQRKERSPLDARNRKKRVTLWRSPEIFNAAVRFSRNKGRSGGGRCPPKKKWVSAKEAKQGKK